MDKKTYIAPEAEVVAVDLSELCMLELQSASAGKGNWISVGDWEKSISNDYKNWTKISGREE